MLTTQMDDTMNVAVKGGPCGEELHSDWGTVRIYSREWAFPPAVELDQLLGL